MVFHIPVKLVPASEIMQKPFSQTLRIPKCCRHTGQSTFETDHLKPDMAWRNSASAGLLAFLGPRRPRKCKDADGFRHYFESMPILRNIKRRSPNFDPRSSYNHLELSCYGALSGVLLVSGGDASRMFLTFVGEVKFCLQLLKLRFTNMGVNRSAYDRSAIERCSTVYLCGM